MARETSAPPPDAEALKGAETVILAVGTPSENGVIDLKYIRAASAEIGSILRDRDDYLSVIVKSTVVPGTTDTVVREEIEAASGKTLGEGFGLGMNPEFLREGEAIEDFMDPDRIVFGHEDDTTLTVCASSTRPGMSTSSRSTRAPRR
jgi:UDPglucose 6-dehydrogenase